MMAASPLSHAHPLPNLPALVAAPSCPRTLLLAVFQRLSICTAGVLPCSTLAPPSRASSPSLLSDNPEVKANKNTLLS